MTSLLVLNIQSNSITDEVSFKTLSNLRNLNINDRIDSLIRKEKQRSKKKKTNLDTYLHFHRRKKKWIEKTNF